jgi:hypothetical protein
VDAVLPPAGAQWLTGQVYRVGVEHVLGQLGQHALATDNSTIAVQTLTAVW